MSPRTSEQFEEIRESRRKQIMDTALELFAEKGYSNTSISLIASTANISKGLLYNYFTSKENLLMSIFKEGMEGMIGLFDQNKDGVLTRKEFIYFINESFNLLTADVHFWKLYFSLMMQPSVVILFEERLNAIITPLIKIMVDYYKQKGVKDPEAQAYLTGALMDGIGFNYVLQPDSYPIEKVKKMVIEIFV